MMLDALPLELPLSSSLTSLSLRCVGHISLKPRFMTLAPSISPKKGMQCELCEDMKFGVAQAASGLLTH